MKLMGKLSIGATAFALCTLSCCLSTTTIVDGANVLAVLPSVWQSHYIFGRRLLQQLVTQNNSVTLLSPHSPQNDDDALQNSGQVKATTSLPKIREIYIDKLLDNWVDMGLSFDVEQAHQQSMLERFTRLIYAGTANADLLLADTSVRKLLRSGEKFDLLVIDLFLSDALLGLAVYYNIPTVVISPNGANTWLNRMIANPQSSALDPSDFLPYIERMSLWERCINTLMGLFEKLTYNFFHMISQQAVYVKHFQALCQLANNTTTTVALPHHRDLTQNLSLVLFNTHPIVQYPRAFLPNVLAVGGVHLQTEPSLPSHLKTFIETASSGVVYISLGADARTVDLTREKLDSLFDVISYMDELRFLIKWENDGEYLRDLPRNVFANAWFPQEAILAHPNVKVFISACGLMSVIESINGLTPILAIPIYTEQFVTARRLEKRGLAVIVPFDGIAYDALLNGIKTLIANNDTYHTKLHFARQLLTAEYGSPSEKFLHYVDLVLRTGGADFLKTHAHYLNFLRTKLFDVIAIIIVGLGGILAVPFLLICCILKRSYSSNSESTSSSTQATNSRPKALQTKSSLPMVVKSMPATPVEVIGSGSAPAQPQQPTHRRLSTSALWTTNVFTTRVKPTPATSSSSDASSVSSLASSSSS